MKNEDKVVVKTNHIHTHSDSAIYGLGVFGALFYFLQHAVTFNAVIIGIGKAIFWPAVLLFKVLTLLQL